MKIVFEGPDGAGKSTIAKLVSEKLGVPLRGRITRRGPAEVRGANRTDLSIAGNCVFDRCYWVSDLVYEPIYNGNLSVFAGEAEVQKAWMEQQDIILVYVRCTAEDIERRIDARGDDLYNIAQILEAGRRYEEFMLNQGLCDITIDNSGDKDINTVVDNFLKILEMHGGNK